MATELQRQIASLKSKQINADAVHKGRPSIFLSAKEAAAVDVEEVYQAGVSGLSALQQHDSRFVVFSSTLFHPSSVRTQRELKSSEENAKLDKQIEALLQLLTIFVAEKASHTVLEYLIRRYRIHELNVNELIKCVLPIHDSKLFARVVQLCTIQGTIWAFLHGVKTTGAPLPRALFVKQLQQDIELLTIVRGLVTTSISLSLAHPATAASPIASNGFERILSFYTVSISSLTEYQSLSDGQLRCLLQLLLGGLRGSTSASGNDSTELSWVDATSTISSRPMVLTSWRRSSCLLLSAMVRRTSLSADLLKVIVSAIASAYHSASSELYGETSEFDEVDAYVTETNVEMVYLLSAICQYQQARVRVSLAALKNFGFDLLTEASALAATRGMGQIPVSPRCSLCDVLLSVKETIDVSFVVRTLFHSLLDVIRTPTDDSVGLEMSVLLSKSLVVKGLVDVDGLKYIVHSCLQSLIVASRPHNPYQLDLLKLVAKRSSELIDECVNRIRSEKESSSEFDENVRQVLSSVFEDLTYVAPTDSGTSILLALQAPSAEVRVSALNEFPGRFEAIPEHILADISRANSEECEDPEGSTEALNPMTADAKGLLQAVCSCLASADPKVFDAAWEPKILSSICSVLHPSQLLRIVDSAWSYWASEAMISGLRRAKALLSIIHCLQERSVMQALSADNCVLAIDSVASQMTGATWCLIKILSLLSGVVRQNFTDLDEPDDKKSKSAKFSKIILELEISACSWFQIFTLVVSGAHVLSDCAAGLKAKISKDGATDSFTNSLPDSFVKSSTNGISLFVSTVFSEIASYLEFELSHELSRTKRNTSVTQFALFFLRLCIHIASNAVESQNLSGPSNPTVSFFGKISLTLNVSVLTALAKLSSNEPECVNSARSSLEKVIALMPHFSVPSSRTLDVENSLIRAISASAHIDVLSYELLSFLLCSSNSSNLSSLLTLVGPCLRLAFTSSFGRGYNAVLPLVVVVLSNFADSSTSEPDKSIPLVARVGAIHAIATWIQAIHSKSEQHQISVLLPVIFSLLVVSLGDLDGSIRQASLVLANKMQSLPVELSISDGTSSGFTSKGLDLAQFSSAALEQSATIAVDASAARAVIVKYFGLKDASSRRLVLSQVLAWSGVSKRFATELLATCVGIELSVSWPFLASSMGKMVESSTAVHLNNGFSDVLVSCLRNIDSATDDLQSEVIAWIIHQLSSTESGCLAVRSSILNQLFVTSSDWGSKIRFETHKNALFKCLVTEYVLSSGDSRILRAASAYKVDAVFSVSLVHEQVAKYQSAFHQALEGRDTSMTSGLSTPVQAICYFIEVMKASYFDKLPVRVFSKQSDESKEVASIAGSILELIRMMTHPVLKFVASAEYCLALLQDVAISCLSQFDRSYFTLGSETSQVASITQTPSKKKSKGKLATEPDNFTSSSAPAGYELGLNQLDSSLRLLMTSIESIHTLHLFKTTLKLISTILEFHGQACRETLLSLSKLLLSLNRTRNGAANSEFITELLSKLTYVLSLCRQDLTDSSSASGQDIIQPLFRHIYGASNDVSVELVNLALKNLGSASLSTSTVTLLSHVHAAYVAASVDNLSEQASDSGVLLSNPTHPEGKDYILLSMAAQRRARRSMRISRAEELFQLAVASSVSQTASGQLECLTALVSFCAKLLELAVSDLCTVENIVSVGDTDASIDAVKTVSYATSIASESGHRSSSEQGVAAALLLIVLEFIGEILDNRSFHVSLVELDAASSNGTETSSSRQQLQQHMLHMSDQLLQLYTSATMKHLALGSNTGSSSGKATCVLQLAEGPVNVHLGLLSVQVGSRCLDILKSMQYIMDAPSFIAIFQELVQHEDAAVRQKALQMLGSRLQDSTNGIGNRLYGAEGALLMDLFNHLRSIVATAPAAFGTAHSESDSAGEQQTKKKGKKSSKSDGTSATVRLPSEKDITDRSHIIGLAQSSILCMDVIARNVRASISRQSVRDQWSDVMKLTLVDSVALAQQVFTATAVGDEVCDLAIAEVDAEDEAQKAHIQRIIVVRGDQLKLSGSLLLLCAAICGVLGPAALSSLSGLMNCLLGTIERQVLLYGQRNTSDTQEVSSYRQARLLLLRSCLSSLAAVVKSLSSFAHPYLSRILTSTLPVYTLHIGSSNAAVTLDVDKCIGNILVVIPPRLSVPCFLSCTPPVLAVAPTVAMQFAIILKTYWNSLERTVLVSYLNDIFAISILCLDYRRVHGVRYLEDQNSLITEVDAKIVDAISHLCLKLTETELKGYVLSLIDWKNISADAADSTPTDNGTTSRQLYCRGTSFYFLVSALCGKLKSLAGPLMAVVWGDISDRLSLIPSLVIGSGSSEEGGSNSSRSKKQKLNDRRVIIRGDDPSADSFAEKRKGGQVILNSAIIDEMATQLRAILQSIQITCSHDTSNFIDQVRYDTIALKLTTVLALRQMHTSDSVYIEFANDVIIPAICSLVVAAAKDTLWKPLNHAILMMSRDKRKSVRLVSLYALKNLFAQAGEEYLLLLPECLPFLAELLEDDSEDVATLAAAVVRDAEELSGENLDAYLQ